MIFISFLTLFSESAYSNYKEHEHNSIFFGKISLRHVSFWGDDIRNKFFGSSPVLLIWVEWISSKIDLKRVLHFTASDYWMRWEIWFLLSFVKHLVTLILTSTNEELWVKTLRFSRRNSSFWGEINNSVCFLNINAW